VKVVGRGSKAQVGLEIIDRGNGSLQQQKEEEKEDRNRRTDIGPVSPLMAGSWGKQYESL